MSERLALEGGRPVRETFLPYARQVIEDDDVEAVVAALRSDWLTTGPRVERLEEVFAERIGVRHAVAYSSGTAALHGTIFAAGLAAGDEVVVPTFTFAASAACVVYQGATPVLADVDRATLNLTATELERRIGSATRAVMVVHYAGVPADMVAIGAVARKAGLLVIEDAAHAAGARTTAGPCGALGDMAVFSLHPAKQLTSGEGGIVTTDDGALAERLRRFRNHCMDTSGRERETSGAYAYTIEELGFNYRLTDIHAALGLAQLAKLDRFVARRVELVRRYDERLGERPELTLPSAPVGTVPSWHLYTVRLDLDLLAATRDDVFAAMRAENIGVNVHYIPVHRLGFYSRLLGHDPTEFPVAEDAFRRILTLPLHPAMSDEDADSVCRALVKVLDRYRVEAAVPAS
jgi:UDP-4-amino-4,6-dideoxy-N-acetyl-beta-L-altrosamine transaminase